MSAYGAHKKHVWLSLGLALIAAPVLLVLALFAPGLWKAACVVIAAALIFSVFQSIRMLDGTPLLRISVEGLYYKPFAARTVAWSDIKAIALLKNYRRFVVMGRPNWLRTPSADQINFALADYNAYPHGPGRSISRFVQGMSGAPPIAIQLYFVDGDGEAIRAEIAKHWGGHVAIIEQRVMSEGVTN